MRFMRATSRLCGCPQCASSDAIGPHQTPLQRHLRKRNEQLIGFVLKSEKDDAVETLASDISVDKVQARTFVGKAIQAIFQGREFEAKPGYPLSQLLAATETRRTIAGRSLRVTSAPGLLGLATDDDEPGEVPDAPSLASYIKKRLRREKK